MRFGWFGLKIDWCKRVWCGASRHRIPDLYSCTHGQSAEDSDRLSLMVGDETRRPGLHSLSNNDMY